MINYTLDQHIAIITWAMTSSPMNVLNDESIPQFEAALSRAFADESVTGIIITSARPEFVAGADLKMILRNNDTDPADMLHVTAELNRIFRTIETSGKPTVAAMNGTALGGGYEICLACHHRIALTNPKALIGLVEVTIGLLPGGGGTQRLPRMIGIQAALPLMLEGRKVGVQEARQLGLVDDTADSHDELLDKAKAWIATNPNPLQPWDEVDRKSGKIVGKDDFKVPGGNVQSAVGAQAFGAGTAMLMEKTKGNYPAPLAIMACVYEGLQVNMDRAIAIEARYFVQVATSKVAKNMIQTLFLGMNEANKGIGRPKDVPKTDVKKLGVLGAGLMGAGIAYVSALAGIEVVLNDVSPEMAEKGKEYARQLLRKGVERGKMTPEKVENVLGLITPTGDSRDLSGCDLIIEAVFEDRDLKAQVISEAKLMLAAGGNPAGGNPAGGNPAGGNPAGGNPAGGNPAGGNPAGGNPAGGNPAGGNPAGGVFASNTSTLPITGLAAASVHPENFIGIHFFSPVDKMPLVEIIVGRQTSDYALAVALDYVRRIRKTPIVVNDSRGFYTSRCFGTYSAEGMEMLREGINPVLIENGGKDAGMPLGPLAVTDEVAIDLVYKIAEQGVKDGVVPLDDTRYQVAKTFVDLGRLGKKVKAGFYDYPGVDAAPDQHKKLWPGLRDLFPVAAQQPTLDEVKTRLLYRQAIEAIRCMDENVVRTKLDADIGSILGWGFPAYTGGVASFVDFVGHGTFITTCDRLADAYGERFRPTERLQKQAGF